MWARGVEAGYRGKRNRERFPEDFMFQLSEQELTSLRCQLGISKQGRGGRRYLPYVFTERSITGSLKWFVLAEGALGL